MAHLHAIGIIHGDLSLKNCLVRNWACVICDPGAAHSTESFLLGAGEEITTAFVRAPERFLGEPLSTSAVDAWACGVIAWCLATGPCD